MSLRFLLRMMGWVSSNTRLGTWRELMQLQLRILVLVVATPCQYIVIGSDLQAGLYADDRRIPNYFLPRRKSGIKVTSRRCFLKSSSLMFLVA